MFLSKIIDKKPDVLFSGPLKVCIEFVFPRNKSHFYKSGKLAKSAPVYMTKKPDIDNLAKFVLDAFKKLST